MAQTNNTPVESVLVERDGLVATVINNDPPRNRMGLAYMDALEELVPQLETDKTVRAVVFTGAGDEHFSVGMNLKQFPEGVAQKGSVDALLDQRLRVLSMIENMSKPTIATLYGYCLGGGLELPLACHFRLAAEEGAQIGLPELDLGTIPAWGGTARLTRCVGRDRCVVQAGQKALEAAIAEERRGVLETMATKDQQEGMAAFLEKRKPHFTGE